MQNCFRKEPLRVVLIAVCIGITILGGILARQEADKRGITYEQVVGCLAVLALLALPFRGNEVFAFAFLTFLLPNFIFYADSDEEPGEANLSDRVRAGYGMMAAGGYLGFACLFRTPRFTKQKIDWRLIVAVVATFADIIGAGVIWSDYQDEKSPSSNLPELSRRAVLAWTSAVIFLVVYFAKPLERMAQDWAHVAMFYFAWLSVELLDMNEGTYRYPETTPPNKAKIGFWLMFGGHLMFLLVLFAGITMPETRGAAQRDLDVEGRGRKPMFRSTPSMFRAVMLFVLLIVVVVGVILNTDLRLFYRILCVVVVLFIILGHFMDTPYSTPVYLVAFAVQVTMQGDLLAPVDGGQWNKYEPLEDKVKAGYWMIFIGQWAAFLFAWDAWSEPAEMCSMLAKATVTTKRGLVSSAIGLINLIGLAALWRFMYEANSPSNVYFLTFTFMFAVCGGLFFFVATHLQQTQSVRVAALFYVTVCCYLVGLEGPFGDDSIFEYGGDKVNDTLRAGRWATFIALALMAFYIIWDLYDGQYDIEESQQEGAADGAYTDVTNV